MFVTGKSSIHAVFLFAGLAAIGCDLDPGSDDSCAGKCDGPDDIAGQLAEFEDPIAKFLRSEDINDDGELILDYGSALSGIADVQGCSQSSLATFVVADDLITNGEPFPRLVSTVCSDNLSRAGEFFIAASFEDQATGDIDLRDVEMFAWDANVREYHFYAFRPVDEERVKLEVEPARCRGCHLTPNGVDSHNMPMTPIMNELHRPWTHWNAEPGFESHNYELPARIKDKPNFVAMAEQHLASASLFEEIISTAILEKITVSRMRKRRDPANIRDAMAMLRPVFCAEHVNYASEEFEAGIIRSGAIIDPGIRSMYEELGNEWPWDWASTNAMRLGTLNSAESLDQVPTRSFADVAAEKQLVANRVLDPLQITRVKALDWKRPVFSDFRCNLWREASERFEEDPPDFDTDSRNLDVMSEVFDAILVFEGTSLVVGDGQFLSLEEATSTKLNSLRSLIEDLDSASIGDCKGSGAACLDDPNHFGDRINEFVVETEGLSRPRTRVRRLRNERICEVLARFPNRPSLPKVDCD